jgi:hypothetical protein
MNMTLASIVFSKKPRFLVLRPSAKIKYIGTVPQRFLNQQFFPGPFVLFATNAERGPVTP